ncbi:hypothetical protein MBLNU457_3664t2 [Dothideomycetes sp. NU457]
MVSGLDQRAQTGFAKAADYDAHRPTYPEESVQRLLENLRVDGAAGATILDLAAGLTSTSGTGKFTESLSSRSESYEIIAVEPHGDMRKVLEDKHLRGVKVMDGLSTNIPLPDASVDAVIIAQDHKATTTWEQTMQDYIWTQDDEQPRFRHQKWKQVFDQQTASGPLALITSSEPLFSLPIAVHEDSWTVWLPEDKVWDRLSTLSQIAILEGEERERVHKIFVGSIASEDTERNEQGDLAIHGGTVAAWTSKIPTSGATSLWEKES